MLREDNLEFDFVVRVAPKASVGSPLTEQLLSFREFGKSTRRVATRARTFSGDGIDVPTLVNEFWTARQRQASSLHEVSYRACFKPQLPRFFIERLTKPGDIVYDPFMGRGTTLLEAALLGRVPYGCDVNPLSQILVRPRLHPPSLDEVAARLDELDLSSPTSGWKDLEVFFHPETLCEITALRDYLLNRKSDGTLDHVDE